MSEKTRKQDRRTRYTRQTIKDTFRCLACDEKGQEIDGDKVIALLAMNMKEKGCLVPSSFDLH